MAKDLVAFQLVKFLEARGVENIFGLCGHTVIGFRDALKESKIRYISAATSRSRRMPPTAPRAAKTARSPASS